MVIGMDVVVLAQAAAHDLVGAVGNDLVGVHVGRGAGAALDGVHDELVMQLAGHDFLGSLDNGVADLLVHQAGGMVGDGAGLLQTGQHVDLHGMHHVAGDGVIQLAAQRLHAVVSGSRDFQSADGVGFETEIAHIKYSFLCPVTGLQF